MINIFRKEISNQSPKIEKDNLILPTEILANLKMGKVKLIVLDKPQVVRDKIFNIIGSQSIIKKTKSIGKLELDNPREIDLYGFPTLYGMHTITNEQRRKWFPNKLLLWGYPIKNNNQGGEKK